ncbi:copper resistance CopC family protein [Alkalicoccobacillus porphyridii]|nr:copper resistance protein CopC [Alkalicoccobacillus porphyridii]
MLARPKMMILAIIVLLVGLPQTVFAHSHIESTVPTDGDTVEEVVETIELSFDGGIEQGATIQITTESGEEIEPADVQVNSPNIEVELAEPLASGVYTVAYQIISADTHPVEGDFTFTVEAEEVTEPEEDVTEEPEVVEEDDANNDETTEEESVGSEETETSTSDEQQTTEEGSALIWIIGGILIVVLIVAGVVMARRKK